jgi:hypothetical protein
VLRSVVGTDREGFGEPGCYCWIEDDSGICSDGCVVL